MAKEIDKIKNNINYIKVLFYPMITFLSSIILIILGLIIKNDLIATLLIFFLIILNPLACLISSLFGIGGYKIKKEKNLLISSIVVIILGLSTILFTIIMANI